MCVYETFIGEPCYKKEMKINVVKGDLLYSTAGILYCIGRFMFISVHGQPQNINQIVFKISNLVRTHLLRG